MTAYADYLMVITPPDNIVKEVLRYKRASVSAIGHFEGMHISPKLVISRQVRCNPLLAQPVISKMADRLSTHPPACLQINGFGFINNSPTTKTIYARIENDEATDSWFKLLSTHLGIRLYNFVPALLIAANIPNTSFDKLWPHFEKRQWRESFTASSLTILHRDTYAEYREWRQYRELFLANRVQEIF